MLAGYSPNFATECSLRKGAADLWQRDSQRGLALGVEGVVIDQHLFQRGRLGRLLEAIVHPDAPRVGLGADAAEMAAQRSFLLGRTELAEGLGLLPVTVGPPGQRSPGKTLS